MKTKAPLIIIGVVIVIALVSVIAYALLQNRQTTQKPSSDGMDMSTMNRDQPTQPSSNESTQSTETNSVTISNFAYSPAKITVKKGTKVTWTNNDSVEHNVIGDDLKELNGPLLKKGESYSYTFDQVGEFSYYCGPHPYMKGTVIVTE